MNNEVRPCIEIPEPNTNHLFPINTRMPTTSPQDEDLESGFWVSRFGYRALFVLLATGRAVAWAIGSNGKVVENLRGRLVAMGSVIIADVRRDAFLAQDGVG